jgi:hypothetical protein
MLKHIEFYGSPELRRDSGMFVLSIQNAQDDRAMAALQVRRL